MSFRPLKRFGQHYLTNPKYLKKLTAAISPKPEENLVEIGAGMGALTQHILPLVQHLHVIEIDKRFIEYLNERFDESQLTIHPISALKFDFNTLKAAEQKLRVFGNLPYNISTPLIFHFLEYKNIISDMVFLLQKEVVDRITAHPGSKTFGRLSVMVQYHCQVQALFDVPPKAFNPPPKVDSSVVRLIPYSQPKLEALDYELFSQIVNAAFQQRRKTIRNALKNFVDEPLLKQLNLDPQKRPEALSVSDFVKIANAAKSQ